MATKTSANPTRDEAERERQQWRAKVGQQVIEGLGKPLDFDQVQVQSLWGDRYRANVLVRRQLVIMQILHSFFVTVDAKGTITASSPAITKLY